MVAPRDIVMAVKPAAWLREQEAGPEWTESAKYCREELAKGEITRLEREHWTELLTEYETEQNALLDAYGEELVEAAIAHAQAHGWAGKITVIQWNVDGEEYVPDTTSTRGSLHPHNYEFVEDELEAAARRALFVDQHKGAWRIRRKDTGEVLREL